MSLEIPRIETIEREIKILNQELTAFSNKAKSQGLEPIDLDSYPVVDNEYTKLRPDVTASGFWCHHIGGPLAAVDVQMYLLEETGKADMEIVSDVQQRLYSLTKKWLNHPIGGSDKLNAETSTAFLKSGFLFDWTKAPSLTRELKDKTADIGEFYTLREGFNPLSFTGMIRGKSTPSRAFLFCQTSDYNQI